MSTRGNAMNGRLLEFFRGAAVVITCAVIVSGFTGAFLSLTDPDRPNRFDQFSIHVLRPCYWVCLWLALAVAVVRLAIWLKGRVSR